MVDILKAKNSTLSYERMAEVTNTHLPATADLVSGERVKNWANVRGNPRFEQLPALSMGIGEDPTFLAAEMGMVPRHSDEITRLVHLHARVADQHALLTRIDRDLSGRRNSRVGSIVSAATQTGRWAVAVWPGVEGPPGYEMHVSDRLDFARVDGGDPTEDDLHSDIELSRALSKAHAVRATASPRWNDLLEDENRSLTLSYSVPRLTALFPPSVNVPVANQGSVAVVALSVSSWAMDVAGFLARILNYGLMTTRGLGTEAYGSHTKDPQAMSSARQVRRQIHDSLLQNPSLRYVWGHFSLKDSPEALFPPEHSWPATLTCVWVRESKDLIRKTMDEPSAEKYLSARADTDRYVESLDHERIITLDMDYPSGLPQHPSNADIRNLRMEMALTGAIECVRRMHDAGFLDRTSLVESVRALGSEGRSSIAHTMRRWIRDHHLLPVD